MKILKEIANKRNQLENIEVIPESSDDIYMLYNLIDKNDTIRSLTTRKIVIEGKDSKKMTLLMDIFVQEINIDLAGGFLFLKGTILSEHENVRIGSFHNIEIEVGKRLKITKKFWNEYSLKLKEEMKKILHSVLFCLFYTEECLIFNVSRNFVKLVQKLQIKNRNVKSLEDYILRYIKEIKAVVLCTFKEEKPSILSLLLRNKELSKYSGIFCEVKLEEVKKKMVPTKVIANIMIEEKHKNIIEKIELKEEFNEMKAFLKNLEFNQNLTAIGIKEIEEAMEYGAIGNLLVTFEKVKSGDLEERLKIESLIQEISKMRCGVFILPANSVYGERLNEIGGIAANLKFIYK